MSKEWNGNSNSVAAMLGMRTVWHPEEREPNDFYSTDPKAVRALMNRLQVSRDTMIYECACGSGNLSKELESMGYNVLSTDLIDRGYGTSGVDFLKVQTIPDNCMILTNPPYKYTTEFIAHAMQLQKQGGGSGFLAEYQLFKRTCTLSGHLYEGMAGEGICFLQSSTLLQKRYQYRPQFTCELRMVHLPQRSHGQSGNRVA